MARYERQQTIGSIARPGQAEAAAARSLAETLQGFGQYGLGKYKELRVQQAKEEAQQVAPAMEAPALNSPSTIYGQTYNDIVVAGHQASVKNGYTAKLTELAQLHGNDPVSFEQKAKAYKAEMLNNVSPELRNGVSLDFDHAMISPLARSKKVFETEAMNQSITDITAGVNTAMDDAAKAARDGNIVGLEHNQNNILAMADQLEAMGQIDLANEARNSLGERVDKQLVLGQADNAIQTGNGAEFIQDFIENPPEDLSPEQVDSYAATMATMNNRHKSMVAQQQAGESIEQSRQVSNLKIASRTGLGDPEELMAKADEYHAKGWIGGDERASIMTSLIKADQDKIAKAEKYTGIAERLQGSDSVVVSTKDQDSYYADVVAPGFETMSPAEAEIAKVEYVNRMKRVPAGLKDELQTLVMSGNPDLIVRAQSLVDKIDQIPGLVDSVFSPQQQAYVQNVIDLRANLDPMEAVELAQRLTDPNDKARIDARTEDLKEMKKGFNAIDYRGEVENMFDPWFGSTLVDDVTGDAMAREYGALFETYYKAGMNEDKAKEESAKRMQRNWSEWQGQVIKYSPDSYYQIAGSSDYVMDQLYNEVKGDYFEGEQVKKKDIILVGTEETARTASTGEPVYRVIVRREDGLYVMPQNWKPDPEKERKRVSRQNKKLIEEQEAEQEALNEELY